MKITEEIRARYGVSGEAAMTEKAREFFESGGEVYR
jgi:hypothetical protein